MDKIENIKDRLNILEESLKDPKTVIAQSEIVSIRTFLQKKQMTMPALEVEVLIFPLQDQLRKIEQMNNTRTPPLDEKKGTSGGTKWITSPFSNPKESTSIRLYSITPGISRPPNSQKNLIN